MNTKIKTIRTKKEFNVRVIATQTYSTGRQFSIEIQNNGLCWLVNHETNEKHCAFISDLFDYLSERRIDQKIKRGAQ